ncbi:N-acylglucosamine 2-epimerase [Dyadobacter sp. BE34]|uniref:N-acylglucosamine 2-epimerase n=1 Tax=Dyadobacter fermentans TaxID=94254 RepID=A0ABU1QTN4_9BACT|nr:MULTISPECIES: AGE family epimerase/isomerase [Dyadobacter]MDR6804362.1 N-acylglucosamine 2-epimerase [Dyadobacter fermentans]MDR7042102.1 N-acylglucosamine 2-epimerase [Dyadobacter sp. BE242]MDR7196505.1 N-acylglucosamine 2-epimerase [Dyadobacter sp. BE34]MDR7212950.1 N-acylglucosamine 2-epimerase [Dyadobacter sp. BE31]MDR7261911.1 N-acylglucosamine 2-epimerase [Dyadobacter sp. BE32]
MQPEKYIDQYRHALLNDVIPFWMKNSPDHESGGFFTCLDREGKVFDTDKFLWLQCRQVWCFAMLYNQVEARQEWLDMALSGAEFLQKHGREHGHGRDVRAGGANWYFSLDRYGNPLMQPHSIFSDCFATMAFGQLYKATGNEEFKTIATETFYNILKRQDNPKGIYSKAVPGARPLESFALPMILCNLVLEIESLLEPALVNEVIERGIDTVMNKFYKPELGVILENVSPDGSFSDSFEGRLVNPGHGLESMWFMMDLAERTSDGQLAQRAVDIAIQLVEYGWDPVHGGIFYFMDVKGNPPQQLEWDQKLWWVHMETLITLLKGYLHTGDERCAHWFERVHAYTWSHFPDPEYGEWFGYLNRQGEPLLTLKGGKWKGCFHVPRGLYQCWKTLEAIQSKVSLNV